MANESDYWSNYWRTDGQQGEVFVNSKGERPKYIDDYWKAQLCSLPKDCRILDIACGAGSIYESLSIEQHEGISLFASDMSGEALEILKNKVPEATLVECSSLDIPYEDQYFDLVVSQFGAEYAGLDAFNEASRLVAPGGKLTILSHYRSGYIDQRNEAFLEGAKLALSCNYIETAIALTKAIFSGSKTKIRKAEKPFISSQVVLAGSLKQNPEGIHRHLYFGYRDMYMKIQNYHEQDVVRWLTMMKADIKKNIVKVSEIRRVSLGQAEIESIAKRLELGGLKDIEISTLVIPDSDNIVGWTIQALRM